MLHISIKPEVVFEIAGFPVTNSILASWILLVLFFFIGLYFKKNARSDSKIAFFIRFVLTKMREFFVPIAGRVGKDVFPVIASIFIFVLLSNWMGLLPGFGSIIVSAEDEHAPVSEEQMKDELPVEEVDIDEVEIVEETNKDATPSDQTEDDHSETALTEDEDHDDVAVGATDDHSDDGQAADQQGDEHHAAFIPVLRGGTADLNMTFALALVSFALIQFYGLRELKLGYIKKFINFNNPLDFFIGILEIVSEISKIISFAFRLFGNIFAGEVLLVVIAFLVPVLASFPFLLLEVFVGVIQALVFAMLTAVFINLATSAHH